MSGPFRRLRQYCELAPVSQDEANLPLFKERLISIALLVGNAMALLAYLPSVVLLAREGSWGLLAMASCLMAASLALLALRGLSYRFRAIGSSLLLYAMGLAIIAARGPFTGGPVWLFLFSLALGIFLGHRAALIGVAVNVLTLVALGFMIQAGMLPGSDLIRDNALNWGIAAVTFVPLSAAAALAVAFLLGSMENTLRQFQETTLLFRSEQASHQQAEDALRSSEIFNRSLVEHLPQRIFIKDVNSVYVSGNANFTNEMGLGPEGLAGKTDYDFFPNELADQFRADDREVMSRGITKRMEERYMVDGREKWANTTKVPFRDAKGQVVGVLGIFDEITERKEMELALRESEEKFRQLIEQSPVVYELYDKDGVQRMVNRAYGELWGIDPQSSMGTFNVLEAKQSEKLRPYLERAYAGEIVTLPDMYWDPQREVGQGRPRWISTIIYPMVKSGQVDSIVILHEDITARKTAEEAKDRLEAQLRQAQKMEAIGTLAGGIAHDFNNMLGAIMGFAEMAREDAETGRLNPGDLDQILNSAERARNLVRQILTFSRKAEPELKPMDINQEVLRTLELVQHTLPKMIAIEHHLAPDLERVHADANQIGQVLMNLITNAFQAMPDGGKLSIATEHLSVRDKTCFTCGESFSGEWVVLSVSDTGKGIDQQNLERIFDPFFTTKAVGSGTGLGLSMVHGIVLSHGGHIECDSRPGQGTTFSIYLPAQPPTPAPETLERPRSVLKGAGETILLVDDEEPLRRLGQRFLSDVGYKVLEAGNGEEALAVYRRQGGQIDLVILDLGMPGMGGRKALKEMLALDPRARVIIASGYSADGQVKDALAAGARGYVAKPFRRAEMLEKVRAVLERRD